FGDIINGDANANWLIGGSGNDFLFGQGGNDSIVGGAGDDQIQGGDGNDSLNGGLGHDILTGGAGADKFVFNPGAGSDTVPDCQVGTDKVVLNGFGPSPCGTSGDGLVNGPGTAGSYYYFGGIHPGDKMVFDSSTHTLYQVDVAYDSSEQAMYITHSTAVATFSNNVQLHTSDFLLS